MLNDPEFSTGTPPDAFKEPDPAPDAQEVVAQPAPAKLFAVSTPLKAGPVKVFEYDNDADGQRQLANLIRGERVIAVILGHRVQVESASVVDLDFGGTKVSQRTSLPDP